MPLQCVRQRQISAPFHPGRFIIVCARLKLAEYDLYSPALLNRIPVANPFRPRAGGSLFVWFRRTRFLLHLFLGGLLTSLFFLRPEDGHRARNFRKECYYQTPPGGNKILDYSQFMVVDPFPFTALGAQVQVRRVSSSRQTVVCAEVPCHFQLGQALEGFI